MTPDKINQLYQLQAELRLAVDKNGISLCNELDKLIQELLLELVRLRSENAQLKLKYNG